MNQHGPSIPLLRHPETDTVLLAVELGEHGPILRLFDYEGKPRIELTADPVMGTAITVLDNQGRDAAVLVDGGDRGGTVALCLPPPDDTDDAGLTALLEAHHELTGAPTLTLRRAGWHPGDRELLVSVDREGELLQRSERLR